MHKITLNIKELQDLLGISASTAYAMVREGSIPHFRVRNKILFNRQVIEAWTRGEAAEQDKKVKA